MAYFVRIKRDCIKRVLLYYIFGAAGFRGTVQSVRMGSRTHFLRLKDKYNKKSRTSTGKIIKSFKGKIIKKEKINKMKNTDNSHIPLPVRNQHEEFVVL